jgi:hypothetical protein
MAYVGLGLQAHLRKVEKFDVIEGDERQRATSFEDLTYGATLTLGMGLRRQVGDVLLGIDAQMRQGAPTDYRSMSVLLSAGVFLD